MRFLKWLDWVDYKGKINTTEILLDIIVFTAVSFIIYLTAKVL